jgi:hypothetical protein
MEAIDRLPERLDVVLGLAQGTDNGAACLKRSGSCLSPLVRQVDAHLPRGSRLLPVTVAGAVPPHQFECGG